jgi:hypothetical protein
MSTNQQTQCMSTNQQTQSISKLTSFVVNNNTQFNQVKTVDKVRKIAWAGSG